MVLVHIDLETFSELNINHVGAHRYLSDPSTYMLMAQWAVDDGPVQVHDAGGDVLQPPDSLSSLLRDPATVLVAFNAEFERLAVRHLWGIEVPPERWLCTMTLAWSQSYVGGLDQVARQMNLMVGKLDGEAMRKLTQPRKPTKFDTCTRWLDYRHPMHLRAYKSKHHKGWRKCKHYVPDDWAKFRAYGGEDVVVSRAIYHYAARYEWPVVEHQAWCQDQRINDRGWPIDRHLVDSAANLYDQQTRGLHYELTTYTGCNPNSGPQMHSWLETQGYPLDNLQAETFTTALEDPAMPPAVRQVLTLKGEMAKTTPKKWNAIQRASVERDGWHWVCGALRFAAAQRTNRWGGRILQPQNLNSARGWSLEQLTELVDTISTNCYLTLTRRYPQAMTALSVSIRQGITAPPGWVLVVCDLSSIESRTLGHIAGCERINTIFAEGKDTYRDLATRLFGVSYEAVTKKQRTYCKPPDLGCGYMLGGPGLVRYARDMGTEMTVEAAKMAVEVWRNSNPEVVRMWYWLKDAIFTILRARPGNVLYGYTVTIWRDERSLIIRLPSGRCIHYFNPRIDPDGMYGPAFTYWGRDDKLAFGWSEQSSHPGKVTENIVQAIARDILRDALLRADDLLIVGHVHDEIVCLVPEQAAESTVRTLEGIMSVTPTWAPGLLLGAEGFATKRYYKG